MASAAAPPGPEPERIHIEHLSTVDLRGMTQAELYTLSRCTASGFDPLRCDDVVIPKIDRTVFNESAGSRKQTYSRLRLAPASAADGSGSSQPPLRRRTLRHGGGMPYQFRDSEPERGENQQIVTLFKELFGMDSSVLINDSYDDLVPITVEYSPSEPLIAEQIGSTVPITVEPAHFGDLVPVLEDPLQSGLKRKRGRPRKNEPAFSDTPGTIVENKVEYAEPPSPPNQATASESVVQQGPGADLDRRILNKDGVEVDLVALGALMDPFEPEIMRRTQELKSEEQLLEFLRGIGGKWGTRRNKRRIVDANEFGNVLPDGWHLLLYVKKKGAHCWIHCRRYISPSGRQFESCKDISSYLLSIRAMQNSNQLPPNTLTETVSSMAVANTVDLAAGDQAKEENITGKVASTANPESSTSLLEATPSKIENVPAVQVQEVTHCGKCNTSFPSQDEYFQHQLSSHRRKRPKSGQSISDGVIVRDGKFECQFCHKTFVERHRYNGHVGAHVRYQGKSADDQPAPPAVDAVSQGTLAKTSQVFSGSDSIVAPEFLPATGYAPKPAPKPYKPRISKQRASKQQGESKELADSGDVVSEGMGADATPSSLASKSEAFPDNCENNYSFGSFDDATITDSLVGVIDNGIEILGGTDKIEGVSDETVVVNDKFSDTQGKGISVDSEQQKTVLGSMLISKENLVTSDIDLDDVPLCDRNGEPDLEDEKYVSNISVCDFDVNDGGLDLSSGIRDQQHLESENHNGGLDISGGTGDQHLLESDDINGGLDLSSGIRDQQHLESEDHNGGLSSGIGDKPLLGSEDLNGGLDLSCGIGDQQHLESEDLICKDGDNLHDKPTYPDLEAEGNMGSGYNSTGLAFEDENMYTFAGMESGKSGNDFASFELNSGLQQYVDGVSVGQAEESKGSEVQYMSEDDDLMFSFNSRNNSKKMDSQAIKKQERSLEFRSFFPSQSVEDSATNFRTSAVEERKNQHFLADSLMPGASNQTYGMENIYATQAEQSNPNDGRNSETQELCLASDSRQNCNNVSLGRYPTQSLMMGGAQGFGPGLNSNAAESFGPGRVMGVQGNLSMNSHPHVGPVSHSESFGPGSGMKNMLGGLNMNAGPVSHSAFSDRSFGFGNMMYPDKGWETPKVDTVGNSSRNFMVGFDGINSQPIQNVMSSGLWRTPEQNLFHAGSTINSAPPAQPTNCFRNFDIISNKGEDIYGVNQKYDAGIGFESLRSGKMQPIEYSFMTGQGSSSSSLPGEPKGFQYGVNAGQGYDSSYWLGNQNQVPTQCVWCKHVFYQGPLPTGAQAGGAIGSICPNCSSKV